MYSSLCEVLGNSFMFWFGFAVVLIFGLCIGSFLNVVILRLPLNESLSSQGSHCFSCGSSIKWYDNIPLISYTILRGRCRNCKSRISLQYPVVEFLNAFLWELLYLKFQYSVETLIYFALTSILIAISFIDEKTFEIPMRLNVLIGILGLVNIFVDYIHWYNYIIGAFTVSVFLFIVWFITDGVGFGDVKLMFFAGFLIGWKLIIVAFLLGCVIAIPVHLIRMKMSNKEHKLAFGPYLSLGIYISLFIGGTIMDLYLSLLGVF